MELNMRLIESMKRYGYKYLVIGAMLTNGNGTQNAEFEVIPVKQASEAPIGLTYLIDGPEVSDILSGREPVSFKLASKAGQFSIAA